LPIISLLAALKLTALFWLALDRPNLSLTIQPRSAVALIGE
jgi:hypothetical protein